MPPVLNEFLVSLTYPPFLSLSLLVCSVVASLLRWRWLARALVLLAFAWSLLWSIPQCSRALRASLERQYPQIETAALPRADAIVVLGGGRYAWLHRADIDLDALDSSRVATGARAWLAGRAPVVILSGGGKRRSEADLMAAAIGKLGVPASALLLEERSHDTRSNALFTAELARRHGIERVLLVTSALHMPRASVWFREAGLEVVAVPVPEHGGRSNDWKQRWVPSRRALWRSGRALKEYAGLLAAHVEAMFATQVEHS